MLMVSYLMVTAVCLVTTFLHGVEKKLSPSKVAGTLLLCFVWPVFIIMGIVWANNMSKIMDDR